MSFSGDDLDRLRAGVARDRDRRIAEAAAARGWITAVQLEEVLRSADPIAPLLVGRGWITPAQRDELMGDRRSREAASFFGGQGPDIPAEARPFEGDPARRFHHYILVQEIGRGGMGRVWKAWDGSLHRWVALKVLNEETPEAARPRFLREARAAARLRHPGLVTVFDAGEHQRTPFLVMELIDGRPFPVRGDLKTIVGTLRKVAVALEEAHAQGVVHRDLKPGNILVDDRGEPHIVDFGLAHLTDSDLRLTRTGSAIGTPLYMAPEQVSGSAGDIGPRTDVYSLGVMLYEALAGRHPHMADSASALYLKILQDDPSNPEGPRDLVTICQKAMEKEAGRRYASAAAFAEDLRRWLDGEPIEAHPPSLFYRMRKQMRRHRLALWAAVALAVVATGGVAGWRRMQDVSGERDVLRRMQPFDEAIRHVHQSFYIAGGDVRGQLDALETKLRELETLAAEPAFARHAGTWTTLGIGWYAAGDFARAETALLKARELGSQEGWISFTLGKIHLERSAAEMIGGFREVQDEKAGRSRTSTLRALEELKRPRETWSGAGDIDRKVAEAWRALAAQDWDALDAACAEGLKAFGDRVGTEEFWVVKGWSAISPEEAVAAYTKAIERRPHFAWAGFLRGNALGKLKRWDEAIADYGRAVVLRPRWAVAWGNLGAAQYWADDPRAIEALDRAIELDPGMASPWFVRGQVKGARGDAQGKLADMMKVLELHPDHENALAHRGAARLYLGDAKGAVEDWERALKIAPLNWPRRAVIEKELEKLKGGEH